MKLTLVALFGVAQSLVLMALLVGVLGLNEFKLMFITVVTAKFIVLIISNGRRIVKERGGMDYVRQVVNGERNFDLLGYPKFDNIVLDSSANNGLSAEDSRSQPEHN